MYFLGALLVQSQRYPDGLSYLEKAQRMTPDSWATYFYMGKAQFQQHDTAAAVRLLRQAVEMNPEDAGSFYLLARALRSQGHVQEADAAMQRVVQLHTTSLDAEKHVLVYTVVSTKLINGSPFNSISVVPTDVR